ncbi:MAG: alkene reductase [Dongia sp.]|jgi:2,4-dienoyl-CoA reductase-like NADH-dependent reductase (Old Yellow Enzyme family)
MPTLFDPIDLGAVRAPNRILMAPLTRGRSTKEHVPTPLMAEYYSQRAGAGLIISEATGISRQGLGWAFAPGLWTEEQTAAWKPIVAAVHKAGGRFFAQLWHMGRIVHPDFLGGAKGVSASATTAPGEIRTYEGKKPHQEARPLTPEEIPGVIEDYRRAAKNAIAAGFDGVELHAANGYLVDQFLRDGTNKRTDAYGGSIDNRLRLLKEATRALVDTVGADRTAVRLSPNDDPQGCGDSNSEALFVAAVTALNDFNLAFLEMRASRPESSFRPATRDLVPQIRKAYKGTLILNSDYHLKDATEVLASGRADAIAFGRTFLANPDLPARLKANAPLNTANVDTYYTQGPEGYTDYPTLDRVPAE